MHPVNSDENHIPKVSSLQSRGLALSYIQSYLESTVQDVEETVGETLMMLVFHNDYIVQKSQIGMLTPEEEEEGDESNGNDRLTGRQLACTSEVAVVNALAASVLGDGLDSRGATALLLVDLLKSGLLRTSESEHHDERCVWIVGVEERRAGDRGDDVVEGGHDQTLYPVPTTTR
jgi:hypothetical protein